MSDLGDPTTSPQKEDAAQTQPTDSNVAAETSVSSSSSNQSTPSQNTATPPNLSQIAQPAAQQADRGIADSSSNASASSSVSLPHAPLHPSIDPQDPPRQSDEP